MKTLLLALVVFSMMSSFSFANDLNLVETNTENALPDLKKFDTSFLRLISKVQSAGIDLDSVRVTGFMMLQGRLDQASAQSLLGNDVSVRIAIAGASTTIITFESSLQAAITAAQRSEVVVLQAPRRVFPQPAFSGHN